MGRGGLGKGKRKKQQIRWIWQCWHRLALGYRQVLEMGRITPGVTDLGRGMVLMCPSLVLETKGQREKQSPQRKGDTAG